MMNQNHHLLEAGSGASGEIPLVGNMDIYRTSQVSAIVELVALTVCVTGRTKFLGNQLQILRNYHLIQPTIHN